MTLPTDDVVAIQQLAAAYCHLMDTGQAEAWANLFTEDGSMEIVDLITSDGREALAGMASMFPEAMPGVRHIVENLWVTEVDGDPDRARMQSYMNTVRAGDTPTPVQTGRYDDELARTPSGWRFARRTLTLDGPLF